MIRRLLHWFAIVGCAATLDGCGGGGGSDATPTPTVIASATPAPSPTPALGAGALDPSFAGDGTIVIGFDTAVGVPRHGVRVLADGSTEVLVLETIAPSGQQAARVIHLGADGAPLGIDGVGLGVDTEAAAFGEDGQVWMAGLTDSGRTLIRFTRGPDRALVETSRTPLAIATVSDLVPLANGGVAVVGRANADVVGVQRFTASGLPDPSFGADGAAAGLALGPPRSGELSTVFAAADSDDAGRVLIAGTQSGSFAFFPIVIAFDATGALDATFGTRGVVLIESTANALAIAIAPDGGAAVVTNVLGLLRLRASGEQDLDYAARANRADVGGVALSFAPDGELTTVGATFVPDEPRRFDCRDSSGGVCLRLAPSVHRLRPDGSADDRFGTAGSVSTDTEPPYGAQGTGFSSFVPAPAHRMTAAGIVCRAAFVCDVIVARYIAGR